MAAAGYKDYIFAQYIGILCIVTPQSAATHYVRVHTNNG